MRDFVSDWRIATGLLTFCIVLVGHCVSKIVAVHLAYQPFEEAHKARRAEVKQQRARVR